MDANRNLKLFISYSHKDEQYVDEFRKHISPLKTNRIIDDWHDRKIVGGQEFLEDINTNLNASDIICLFISANFLDSDACMKEKNNALELKKKKGIVVLPIIISPCLWKEINDIKNLLAFPKDSKPVTSFNNHDEAWLEVSNGIKDIIHTENKTRLLKITDSFMDFLTNSELLTKTHPQKDKLFIEDIFVYPELEKYDELRDYDRKINSIDVIENICDYPKILIAGQNQSGKTTLCKKLFIKLREMNLIPVYIHDSQSTYKGIIENRINNAIEQQYQISPINEIDSKKIVPILDDFHLAINKTKHINDLSKYILQVIIVDDIFDLNIKNDAVISSFTHFKIKEFIPSLRNELYKKWAILSNPEPISNTNEKYKRIDHTTEIVDTALGKIIGSGIMPAYPFFILSVISTYEAFQQPLDQQITSQGYCYQALIYVCLRKQGVKNDDIDTYINFLSELAYYFYINIRNEISRRELDAFLEQYLEKYNLPVKQDELLGNLIRAAIISLDNFDYYSFQYRYLYYFFVAKFLADHVYDNKDTIISILSNLHKDENAYIALFVSYHTKDQFILDEIISNAKSFFQKYSSANLSKKELDFFDKQVDFIVEQVLPPGNSTAEQEREKRLKSKDAAEEVYEEDYNDDDIDEDADTIKNITMELRRSIKTVEVMGLIIKNRAGSLQKPNLEFIFEEGMNVHLRILTSFFELIKYEDKQKEVIIFFSERLNKLIHDINEQREKEGKKIKQFTKEELEEFSKTIYWNTNFSFINAVINKIVRSLGSDKLTSIIDTVCDKINTPATFLVKHGIKMWYDKNLQIDEIEKLLKGDDICPTTKKVKKNMVINHASMHTLKFKEKQIIENKLKIPTETLLIAQERKQE